MSIGIDGQRKLHDAEAIGLDSDYHSLEVALYFHENTIVQNIDSSSAEYLRCSLTSSCIAPLPYPPLPLIGLGHGLRGVLYGTV